jgi:hypothetical protein
LNLQIFTKNLALVRICPLLVRLYPLHLTNFLAFSFQAALHSLKPVQGAVNLTHQKEVQVNTSEYGKRVIALFKSGKATKAQKAEMVEAVLFAFERGLCNVAAIHKAIGYLEGEG